MVFVWKTNLNAKINMCEKSILRNSMRDLDLTSGMVSVLFLLFISIFAYYLIFFFQFFSFDQCIFLFKNLQSVQFSYLNFVILALLR